MPVLPQGFLFAPGPTISGSKPNGHLWRYCPYSTQSTNYNGDSRVPEIEKTYHPETNGLMFSYSIGGPMSWVCPDNGCAFYLGTAITQVIQKGTAGCPTLAGTFPAKGRTVVSGTRFLDI